MTSTPEHDIAISIHAFYSDELEAGLRACERALMHPLNPKQESLVRYNRTWYTPRLETMVSTRFNQILVEPYYPNWTLFNPTIAVFEEGYLLVVRSSNYRIVDGAYVSQEEDKSIRTENILLKMSTDLAFSDARKIVSPPYEKTGFRIQGLEDARLLSKDGEYYVSATVQDVAPHDHVCRMALAKLETAAAELSDLKVLDSPEAGRYERNWMPIEGRLQWIYRHAPLSVIDSQGLQTVGGGEPLLTRAWRGGSQYVKVDDGYLGLIHEVAYPATGRVYEHRFVLLNEQFQLAGWSPVFSFKENRAIEFATGLARRGSQLIASFGVRDVEAWVVELSLDEILRLVEQPVPWGHPPDRMEILEGQNSFVDTLEKGFKAEHDFALCVHAFHGGEFELGRRAAERALMTELPPSVEALVRRNRTWYTPTLDRLLNTKYVKYDGAPFREGWSLFNPTIIPYEDNYLMLVRSSNYRGFNGRFFYVDVDKDLIRTENLLVHVSKQMEFSNRRIISNPVYEKSGIPIEGFEDVRLFSLEDRVFGSFSIWDNSPTLGHCQIAMAQLDVGIAAFKELHVIPPPVRGRHEKNWMPIEGLPRWVYIHSPLQVIDRHSHWLTQDTHNWRIPSAWRGGTQYIKIERGYLGLVHEVSSEGAGYMYEHRFVLLDDGLKIIGWSPIFSFRETRAVEFAAGLSCHGDQILVSFGVRDWEAWIVELSLTEVLSIIRPPGVLE